MDKISKCPAPIRCIALLSLSITTSASAAIYYVDFAGGSDKNPGTSESVPWKHCPGDASATDQAARTILIAGDEVRFKGGVVYRGQIQADCQGGSDAPIAYRGDKWGAQRAVLSGAVEVSLSWKRCTSPAEARGNPNYANVWYTPIPEGYTSFFQPFLLNGEQQDVEQSTSPEDRLFIDDLKSGHIIPKGSALKSISSTECIDPEVLRSNSSSYYEGCYISIWVQGNLVRQFPISGFFPEKNKISYDTGGAQPYADRDNVYSILNNPATIDEPGECAVDQGAGRIYIWPRSGGDPNLSNAEVVMYQNAFRSLKGKNLHIRGFEMRNYFGGYNTLGAGAAVYFRGLQGAHENIVIEGNWITNCRSMDGYGVIHFAHCVGLKVSGNTISSCMRSSGMRLSGSNIQVKANDIHRIGRTGIYFGNVQSGAISGNTVHTIRGVHGNGISAYQGCAEIFITGNVVYSAPSILTVKDGSGFYIANNIFDARGEDARVSDWGGITGNLYFVHNACINNPSHSMLSLADGPWKIFNNILDGGASTIVDRGYNVYTGLMWNQDRAYGWALAKGEFVNTNTSQMISRSEDGRYSLPEGSPVVDAGSDLKLEWLKSDFHGKLRLSGDAVDIGPIELLKVRPTAPQSLRVVGEDAR